MIDAGADGIIGAHPHVLQGFEYYKNKPVAYSLGNFLFPDYVKGPTAQTGLLRLRIDDGRIGMEFDPYSIKSNQIAKLNPREEEKTLKYLESISYHIQMKGTRIQPK